MSCDIKLSISLNVELLALANGITVSIYG